HQGSLARKLAAWSGLDRVFFTNSGTEAVDGAMKLARLVARKPEEAPGTAAKQHRFLALENSFHGRTFGAISVTSTEKYRLPFAPVVPGAEFVRFNDVADLESKFDGTICAILLETILTSEAVASRVSPGMHGTTFGGGPLACATALEFLETVESEKLLENIRARGAELREGLAKLAAKFDFIREIRGEGLMVGVELSIEGAPFVAEAMQHGLLINCTHDFTLRLLPPFIINRTQVREFLRLFE